MIDFLGRKIKTNLRLIMLLSSFLVSFILSLLLTKLHYTFGTFLINVVLFIVIYVLAVLLHRQFVLKEHFGPSTGEDEENGQEASEDKENGQEESGEEEASGLFNDAQDLDSETVNMLTSAQYTGQEEDEQIATNTEQRSNSVANIANNSETPLTMDQVNTYSEEMISNEETSIDQAQPSILEQDSNTVILTKSTLDYMLKTPVNVTVNLNTSDLTCNSNSESSSNGSSSNGSSSDTSSTTVEDSGSTFSNIDMNTIADYTLDKQQNYINQYRNSQKCPVCPVVDNRPWSNYESDI
jgi:hypothetical protein